MPASVALRFAFVLVHAGLWWLATHAPGYPIGDVSFVYKYWAELGLSEDYWMGIDAPWVYPVLALVPIVAAHTLGPALYESVWLAMVVALNAGAFLWLTGFGSRCRNAAIGWWWLGFLALLGPVALGRIDSVTVPLAIVGVLLIARHPHTAGIVLAIVTWMKVWPAAVLAGFVVAARSRWQVAAGAVGLSVVVLLGALALGAGRNVVSFFGQQSGRGLQIEAPVSLVWLWQAAAGVPGAAVVYDEEILTYQVVGAGVDVAAVIMTPLLGAVAVAIVALALFAVRRGAPEAVVIPPLVLGLVTALIAFNKVGSPQFISWLAVPVILGLLWRRASGGPSFTAPAVLVLVLAAATHAIYPYLYGELIALNPFMLTLLTARNLLVFVLLAWAIISLVRAIARIPDGAADLQVVARSIAV